MRRKSLLWKVPTGRRPEKSARRREVTRDAADLLDAWEMKNFFNLQLAESPRARLRSARVRVFRQEVRGPQEHPEKDDFFFIVTELKEKNLVSRMFLCVWKLHGSFFIYFTLERISSGMIFFRTFFNLRNASRPSWIFALRDYRVSRWKPEKKTKFLHIQCSAYRASHTLNN